VVVNLHTNTRYCTAPAVHHILVARGTFINVELRAWKTSAGVEYFEFVSYGI
jgi:hypothetical protein